ncbi:MAG: peptide chain release factor 2 [Lentisphaeria bacterium]|nr:peptide chain release factor 2 [Lentisphaeria bacterium]
MTPEELHQAVKQARRRLDHLRGSFDIGTRESQLAAAEADMSRPDFWDRKEAAQQTVGEVSRLRGIIDPYRKLLEKVDDFTVLAELVEMEGEESDMLGEADSAAAGIQKDLDKLELVSFLSGKMDKNNAILSVHAGAGGTESCDWAAMLFRMYTRWAEDHGHKIDLIDHSPGDEAGIKSATIVISGDFVYGYLKHERGVHRLVRISPFDSNKRRHTSFAAVDIVAEVDDDIDIDIDEKDLRVDVYRSSGAGGQHVNTTDSAVRITHIPSNIVVACQNERSQHKNRATAMRVLKARLYEREEEKRQAEAAAEHGQKSDNAWGNQIRSYVLHPYQMVKDLRTDVETSNTQAVLDGDIDRFIEAMLRKR